MVQNRIPKKKLRVLTFKINYMKMYMKYILIFFTFVLLFTSCGEPTESMEDFIKRTCDKEAYDCDCYSKKVKDYFKSEDAFAEWKEADSDGFPKELIDLRGQCSKDEWDF